MNADIDISNTVLTTARLILRPFREDDLDEFFAYACVDGVGQMAGWAPHRSKADTEMILNDFIAGKKTFALEYEGKLIGSLGIEKYDEEQFSQLKDLKAREIGYVLAKEYWGKGLMTEAVKEVIRFLFEECDLDALLCGHFLRNKRSARVIEKSGFRHLVYHEYKTRMDTLEEAEMCILYKDSYERRKALRIKHAEKEDLNRMLQIYEHARRFMDSSGNPLQWGPTKWPPEDLLRKDTEEGNSYVCVDGEGKIVGTFYYVYGEDIEPTYRKIEDGCWQDDSAYGVIHRIACDHSVSGIGKFCIEWAYERCGHLRIDTHGDNIVMRKVLEKLGFVHCGTTYVEEDDYPRLAYEKSERLMKE